MIKCKLIYKNGIRHSIDFLDNENQIHYNVKNALLEYCRYNIPFYESIEDVALTCLLVTDYSLFGNNCDLKLNEIIYSQQKVIPSIIHVIPIESTDINNCFSYLDYNQSFTSTSEIIALKDINGILISVKNELKSKYETVKISNIELESTIYNDYIPNIYINDEILDLSIEQFIKFKLNIDDELIINIETGELLPAQINNDHVLNYKCECGQDIIIESNKLVCSSKYETCLFDYITIINNYLDISDDNELYDIHSNYELEDSKEFIDYVLSLSKIDFYQLTNEQKCSIFNLNTNIIFDNSFNIDQCLKSLTYSQGIPMKHKKEYIAIIKGLYNDK